MYFIVLFAPFQRNSPVYFDNRNFKILTLRLSISILEPIFS